ncbi:MAG TPA: hypothetical protein VGC50_10290 [Gammaproteobacteria bacterium]|jgi:hypothetical protein
MDSVLGRPVRARLLPLVGLGALVAAAGLAACAPGPQLRAPAGPAEAIAPADFGGELYLIDPEESEIHLLVYRTGALARLGHNHVIAARGFSGHVAFSTESGDSEVTLELPVSALEVDPQRLRAQYGEAFSSEPTVADVDGTRANMLGPALLDAEAYPFIRITGSLRGGADRHSLEVSILVKETTARRDIAVALARSEERIVAEGSAELTHGELGLTPFSVMLGALQVADSFEVRLRIVARRADDS